MAHTLAISDFDSTRGLLTLLNDEGWLQVCYLGTEPPQVVQTYAQNKGKELSYDKLNEEYNAILQ